MGMKDANIFEQHVEKIVLAVAAAGAAFMGYLSFQKITIPDSDIGPNNVEERISNEIEQLEVKQAKIAQTPPVIMQLNYEQQYRSLASAQPLPVTLLAADIPLFGPKNLGASGAQVMPEEQNFRIVAPTPVAPELVTAEAWQQLVGIAPPTTPGVVPDPLPAGTLLPTHDQNAAVIQGFLPLGKMRLEMVKVQDMKERMPPQLQKAVVYRIRVQRHERTPSGWTEYKEIQPSKASVGPTPIDWTTISDVDQTLAGVDAEFKPIVIPDFNVDQEGNPIGPPILSRPIPRAIENETKILGDDLQKAGTYAPAAGGLQPVTPPVPVNPGPGAHATTGPAGVAANAPSGATFPQTPDEIKALPVVPFAFWDDSVQPDHTYQYQVEVDFVNPLYHWKFGLKNPALQNQPVLTTGWFTIQTPVVIRSDLVFFITGSGSVGGGDADLSARVYKKNNGKWYWSEFTARPGMNIAGQIPLVDHGNESMEVDTNYTVVDVQPPRDGAGNNVHVVLRDPLGVLVTRDSTLDRDADKDLMSQTVKRTAATTNPATPAETVTPPPVHPPTTRTAPPPVPTGNRPLPTGNRPMPTGNRGM